MGEDASDDSSYFQLDGVSIAILSGAIDSEDDLIFSMDFIAPLGDCQIRIVHLYILWLLLLRSPP